MNDNPWWHPTEEDMAGDADAEATISRGVVLDVDDGADLPLFAAAQTIGQMTRTPLTRSLPLTRTGFPTRHSPR